MSGLFSRALTPSLCLLQLPAPLRQCSPLHISLLARQAVARQAARPVLRLFHASPMHAVRKPKTAIVKPANAPTPMKPRPSSPPKKAQKPFQSHPPNTAPQTILHHASTSDTANIAPAEATSTQAITPQRYQSQQQLQQAHNPYSGIVEKLALRSEPTVVYEARSQNVFVGVCYTSAIFLTWVSYATWKNYETGVLQGNVMLAVAGIINCGMFAAVASYFTVGPLGLVKRIVAVPATVRTTAQPLRPTLRIEPVAILFGKYPQPFEVQMGDVLSDRPFAREMEKFARLRARGRTSEVFNQFFGWLGQIWNAYLKMFARMQHLTYVRVGGKANYKLDLRNCETIDNALDALIKVDTKPIHFAKRMLRPN
ncbi:hypothetical protein BDV97DRAFT_396384 [Delphinella strobiligena]|nr:hypothetical protein BDV97DRAFT_396384 [Delphinella strobiligena]